MREVYALIYEAHSDDDRLLGVYSSLDAAIAAAGECESEYQFVRIECRELDGEAGEYSPFASVWNR
mgnify:CR=1 FL=1